MPLYRNVKVSDTLRIGDALVTFERVKGQTLRVRIEGPATVTQIKGPPEPAAPAAVPVPPREPTLFRSPPAGQDDRDPGARVPTSTTTPSTR